MSDDRLRQLERELAADPTPARRDRLALERERAGDRTWLPVRYADSRRWERDAIPILFALDPEAVLAGLGVSVAWAGDVDGRVFRPTELRGVSLVAPWIDPLAEARAVALDVELRHGVRTLAELAAARGIDWHEALAGAVALRGEDAP